MADPVVLGLTIVVGLAAGFLSGLFGVGGGILMVPALLYIVPGTTFHVAKAASLLAMSLATVVGVWRHRRHGNVDLETGLVLGLGGVIGAAVGVLVAERVDGRALAAAFGLLLAITGARLIAAKEPEPRAWTPGRKRAIVLAMGVVGGVLAGFFGIGGGIFMVPALVASGVGIHVAVGTSLAAVLVNAWAATATNLALGYASAILALGLPAALGGLLGSRLGSDAAARTPARRLRAAFGFLLILVGAGMLVDALMA